MAVIQQLASVPVTAARYRHHNATKGDCTSSAPNVLIEIINILGLVSFMYRFYERI